MPATANPDLTARGTARDDYHALEATGGEWAPPYLVRESLSQWEFREASVAMTAASEVLDDRDALTAVSARLGVSAPNDLETRFEEAILTQTLDDVEVELEQRTAVAETLIATRDQVAAPRTPLADLGMAGELPTAGLDAGLAAFTAGDLDGALAGAAATSALLVSAEEIGRGRAIAIGAGVVGLLLLVLAAIWSLRRRRRRLGTAVGVVAASPFDAGAAPDTDDAGWSAPFAATDVADPGAGPDSPTTLAPTPDPTVAGADPPPAASPPASGVDPD